MPCAGQEIIIGTFGTTQIHYNAFQYREPCNDTATQSGVFIELLACRFSVCTGGSVICFSTILSWFVADRSLKKVLKTGRKFLYCEITFADGSTSVLTVGVFGDSSLQRCFTPRLPTL